jgi:predicted GNAT family acetyltransferase
MEVKHITEVDRGAFISESNGREVGLMTYVSAGKDKIIIDHTEVFPEFEGKGIGTVLVMEAVKYARDNHLKIMPLCSFARKVFRKTPEINDVLY